MGLIWVSRMKLIDRLVRIDETEDLLFIFCVGV